MWVILNTAKKINWACLLDLRQNTAALLLILLKNILSSGIKHIEMKTTLLAFLIFTGTSVMSQTSKDPDAITGVWLTGEGEGKVEIFRNTEKFQGKIVWLKEPIDEKTGKPKTDQNHPDKANRDRPIIGLVNLWGFKFNSKDKWENGRVYDPKNGKEYKCVISLKDLNTLEVRGYVGITLIGRTEIWKRQPR